VELDVEVFVSPKVTQVAALSNNNVQVHELLIPSISVVSATSLQFVITAFNLKWSFILVSSAERFQKWQIGTIDPFEQGESFVIRCAALSDHTTNRCTTTFVEAKTVAVAFDHTIEPFFNTDSGRSLLFHVIVERTQAVIPTP
jgi:hypothetical protein